MTDTAWERPSRRLLAVRRTQVAVVTVPLLVAAVVVGVLAGSPLGALVAGVVVLALSAVAGLTTHRRYAAWGYQQRDDDLVVRRGVLFARLSVVPYGRMQFVDVTAGPFERAYGLSTVRLHTAAAASDARIPGLPAETARALRDSLARRGEARAMGL